VTTKTKMVGRRSKGSAKDEGEKMVAQGSR
jgi:hypothetical protein